MSSELVVVRSLEVVIEVVSVVVVVVVVVDVDDVNSCPSRKLKKQLLFLILGSRQTILLPRLKLGV